MTKNRTNLIIFFSLLYIFSRVYFVLSEDVVFDSFDSIYYFDFKLINTFRLPIITLVFSVLQNHDLIVIFQSVFSSLSWMSLVYIGIKKFNFKISKLFYFLALISLSYSQVILVRDSHLLSESLTLSTSIFLVASTLNLKSHNLKSNLMFLFSLLLFSGVKSTNSIVGLLIFIMYIFFISFQLKNKIITSKLFFPIIFVGVLLINFGHSTLSSSISAQLNTSAIINFRVWGNDSWKEYLLDSNYPPELRTIWRDRQNYNLGQTPDQGVVNELIYQNWWNEGGSNFLVKFMIDHPTYTLAGPFILPKLNLRTDYSYTLIHAWAQDPRINLEILKFDLPTNILWQEERLAAYVSVIVFLAILGFYFLLSQFKHFNFNTSVVFRLCVVMIFLMFWSYFSWWFGSKPGTDILRHQEMPAVLIRIILIFSITQIIESLTKSIKIRGDGNLNKLGH